MKDLPRPEWPKFEVFYFSSHLLTYLCVRLSCVKKVSIQQASYFIEGPVEGMETFLIFVSFGQYIDNLQIRSLLQFTPTICAWPHLIWKVSIGPNGPITGYDASPPT